jgi:DNA-binding MarR family transcriptional regulator
MPDEDLLATWRAFLNAHDRVTRAISRDLAAAGLPDLSWYDLLWAVYRGPLRVKELADAVVLSPTAMSRFVDRVEAAGYVRREPDPADRRALQVTITDEGRALLKRMWPIYSRGIDEYFGAQLGRAETTVRTALEGISAAAAPARPAAARPSARAL